MFEFDVRCIYGCVCFYNSTILFLTVLRLAGMRACPRVRHARGLRARAHYAARDGWRARARAQIYCRGCGFVISIPARILPVAIFTHELIIHRGWGMCCATRWPTVTAVLRRPNGSAVGALRIRYSGESSSPPTSCVITLANEKLRRPRSPLTVGVLGRRRASALASHNQSRGASHSWGHGPPVRAATTPQAPQ